MEELLILAHQTVPSRPENLPDAAWVGGALRRRLRASLRDGGSTTDRRSPDLGRGVHSAGASAVAELGGHAVSPGSSLVAAVGGLAVGHPPQDRRRHFFSPH